MSNANLRCLAALLSYPEADLIADLPEIRQALATEPRLNVANRAKLNSLIDYLSAGDPYDVQEAYVARFDTGRATSLHLFEHVHGESRDRGQAMVDLRGHYEEHGLYLSEHELPDYLPVVLEFLSTRGPEEATELLADFVPIIHLIGQRLAKWESPWSAVFPVILELSALAGLPIPENPGPEPAERSLDDEYAEAPAFADPRLAPVPRHDSPLKLPASHPLNRS